MEIHISDFTKRSFSGVRIVHPGENDIVFPTSGYASTKPTAIAGDDDELRIDLFSEVNDFVKRLPKESQLKLYECYARIDNIFQACGFSMPGEDSSDDLDYMLAAVVKDIYEIVSFDDLREYVNNNTRIKLPPELSDDYVTNDKITPLYKERTYRLSEYIDLVAVALGLRFMIPVWGAYLPIASKEFGPQMKEYYAYQLLVGSRFFDCRAFERLEVYIRANLNENEFDLGVLLKFLSSEEIPTYLIALSTIRKLSIAPISAESERDHLMKIIYNYALGNNNRLATAFGQKVQAKKGPGEVNIDDNSSVWCIFKMKEQVCAGDLAMFQLYIMNDREGEQTRELSLVNAAKAIVPDIDPERVLRYVDHALKLTAFDPRESQIGMCMWVISPIVPGCVIEMFDRQTLLAAMGISQAVLHHWNLPQLAILLTAAPIELEEEEIMAPMTYLPISTKHMERLEVIYPYTLAADAWHDSLSKDPNAGVRGIETITHDLLKNYWEPRCERELAASYADTDVTRCLEVSSDIRDQLCKLLIKLDEHIR